MQCLRIGFELGLITKEELISFGESKVMEGNYNRMFIDMASLDSKSIIKDFNEILEKIEINQSGFSGCHARILYYLKKEYENWQRLRIQLLKYYDIYGEYLDNEDFEFWSRLKDDYELRREGFSGCMKMPNELENYLQNKIALFDYDRLISTLK